MKRKNLFLSLTLIVLLLISLLLLMGGCNKQEAVGVPTETTVETTEGNPATETILPATDATEIFPEESTEATPESEPTAEESTQVPETKASEPKPTKTEPAASEPKPTEPKATEPKATQPKATELRPTQPAPTEPRPTQPQPTEPKPSQPKPTEPRATEPTPTEPKPTQPAPTEPKPTEAPHLHSWSGWSQAKAPTCSASGEETRSCSGCGVTETQAIPATGNHSWSETSATCTLGGTETCTVCGKTETTEALGHAWIHHEEEGHWQDVLTCYCGEVFHSYEDWYNHSNASPEIEWHGIHAGYSGTGEWIVDSPAYDICSRCGAQN